MFNFLKSHNGLDTSLFDPEEDMDLVALINEARTEEEIQSVARMSQARMRARRAQFRAARRPQHGDAAVAQGFSPSLIRSF